jgi:hypothetical protein
MGNKPKKMAIKFDIILIPLWKSAQIDGLMISIKTSVMVPNSILERV